MKKRLAQIFLAFMIIFPFLGTNIIRAGDIQSIDLEATVHEDGSVTIKDTRVFTVYEGTEHFISLGNLGESELLSYAVYDESGNKLEDIGDWDIKATRKEKAGKYGINHTNDGFEICFGFGEYGQNKFTIEYTLSNFIFNLEDGKQAFYWSFLNKDMDPIDQANLMIRDEMNSTFEYPEVRIWGFGYVGQTEIGDNYLRSWTTEPMNGNNYMVILSIFDIPLYQSINNQPMTSESLIEKALEGASYSGESGNSSDSIENNGFYNNGLNNFKIVDSIFPVFFTFGLFFMIAKILKIKTNKKKRVAYRPSDDINYYREIPHNSFIDTYVLTDSNFQDVLSAFILKWIFEGRIQEYKDEAGIIFKKEKVNLQIKDFSTIDNEIENELFSMLVKASGNDHMLTEKEFSKYVKSNSKKISSWLKSMETKSEAFLHENKYYKTEIKKILGLSKYNSILTEKGKKLADEIYGFKKYLEEYSLVSERSASEVRLWNDYLIWASYLGIAEKVYKEFEIVNPEYVHNEWNMYYTFSAVNAFSRSANQSYVSATQSSYSGGGGGSFSGGGGGSFGGGSGGGSR